MEHARLPRPDERPVTLRSMINIGDDDGAIINHTTGEILRVAPGDDVRYAHMIGPHIDNDGAVSYSERHGKPVQAT